MSNNSAPKKAKRSTARLKDPAARPDAIKISHDAKAIVLARAVEMTAEKGRLVNLREALDEIVIEWKSGLKPDEYRKIQRSDRE